MVGYTKVDVLRYDVPRQDVPRRVLDVRGGRLGRCCWTVVWYVEERGKMRWGVQIPTGAEGPKLRY